MADNDKKAVVAVTRRVPSIGVRMLERDYELLLHDSSLPPDRARLAELLSAADAAVTLLSDGIDAELLSSCPRLKVVANHAVGYENIDVGAATGLGIWVANTPGVLTDATADLTMALILSVGRRIVEADAFMRRGDYKAWDPRLLRGLDLSGSVLGVFGFGRIGRAVARRAAAFGMKILYTDPDRRGESESAPGAKWAPFETLLKESDVLTLHCPYLPELHRLMNAETFAAMKSSSIFINTARGKLMDERALCEALKAGHIAGAGLDVYENEPDFVADLARLDNVVMLPHIGSATHAARDAMAELAAKNVIAVLEGGRPLTPVNDILRRGDG